MRVPFLPLVAILAVLGGCKPPDIVIRETPIRVVDERMGSGRAVADGDAVRVNYVIKLPGGKVILDQDDYQFTVGTNSVIRGIDEAVRGMKTGGTRVFTCPPHKHWGRAGYGRGIIPPATDILVSLDLVRIEQKAKMRVGSAEGE
jgi:FK506-binding nuclear protein